MGKGVVISFGTVLTKASIELGENVYIGAYCLLGDVAVGNDTLIADHVCIPSGADQHGLSRLDVPVREQAGQPRTIHIGRDSWIGSGSVILADVGEHCVVGAGSVVTRPVKDYEIVAGNPARVIGDRREKAEA
jgi:acetyltransferase-like isoleucine patch superfamily enzyme